MIKKGVSGQKRVKGRIHEYWVGGGVGGHAYNFASTRTAECFD